MPKVSLSDSQIDDIVDIVLEGTEGLPDCQFALYARGRTIRDIQSYLEEQDGSDIQVSEAPEVHGEVSATS